MYICILAVALQYTEIAAHDGNANRPLSLVQATRQYKNKQHQMYSKD